MINEVQKYIEEEFFSDLNEEVTDLGFIKN